MDALQRLHDGLQLPLLLVVEGQRVQVHLAEALEEPRPGARRGREEQGVDVAQVVFHALHRQQHLPGADVQRQRQRRWTGQGSEVRVRGVSMRGRARAKALSQRNVTYLQGEQHGVAVAPLPREPCARRVRGKEQGAT